MLIYTTVTILAANVGDFNAHYHGIFNDCDDMLSYTVMTFTHSAVTGGASGNDRHSNSDCKYDSPCVHYNHGLPFQCFSASEQNRDSPAELV